MLAEANVEGKRMQGFGLPKTLLPDHAELFLRVEKIYSQGHGQAGQEQGVAVRQLGQFALEEPELLWVALRVLE